MRTRAFYRELLARSPQLPGIRAAALAQSVPLGFTAAQKQVKIPATGPDPMAIWMNTVTPGYFELMHMPLVAGRTFTDRDTDRTMQVAIVNETMTRYWSERRAIGDVMDIDGRKVEVVGIVRTVKYQQVGEAPRPFFYLPYAQNYVPRMSMHIATNGPPAREASAVLAAARAIDPAQPASEIRPLDQFLSAGALFGARIGVSITGAAGGCAWLLSLAGLYACTASAVNRRRREIGIRVALGASRWAVMRLVLRQGVKLATAGIAIGLFVAALAGHWISRIVSAEGSLHLPPLAFAGSVVAITCLAACLVPAWHAASEDPAIALRRN